jgi:hypothetical protein
MACAERTHFLHGFHARPGVEDDGEGGNEADQQHRRFVAEAEPEAGKSGCIGEARDGRADAHEREEDVFRPARTSHGKADRDAEKGRKCKARQQAN